MVTIWPVASRPVAWRWLVAAALTMVVGVGTLPAARGADFDDSDVARIARLNADIATFEQDIRDAIHGLSRGSAEQLEAYSYVELNLEAAHERMNTVFMLVAISLYMDTSNDQSLVRHVLIGQILPVTRNYLREKNEAIASMALVHPDDAVFAGYRDRANALLAGHALPLVDELAGKIGPAPH